MQCQTWNRCLMHRMTNQGLRVFVDINIPRAHLLGRDLRLEDVKAKGNKMFAEEQIFWWLGVALLIMNDWNACRSMGCHIPQLVDYITKTVCACNTAIRMSYSSQCKLHN
jgi:hypothetical protein